MNLGKLASRHLRGEKFIYAKTFAAQTVLFARTQTSVRLFYAASLFVSIDVASWAMEKFKTWQFVEPLWPLFGYNPNFGPILPLVFGSWIFGSALAIWKPQYFIFRFMQAIGVFYSVAITNSDGHFGHNYFAFMWISLAFLLLPNGKMPQGWKQRLFRQRYLLAFFGAQFIVCVFYFMTGLWKVRSLIECAIVPGMVCELSEKMLTNIAAQELISYRKFAPFHQILFVAPWIGFVSYMGTIWLHLISLYFVFRPRTHVLFGSLRILFHFGTLILFGVDFSAMTIAVISIFLFSPFQVSEVNPWREFSRLPPFGFIRSLCCRR